MNISGSFGEINKVAASQSCKSTIDSIEEIVSREVVRRLYLLSFEHSPESLRNVEIRGIRRQEEKIQSSLLPYLSQSFMYLLLCTSALSGTTNVSFFIVRENRSRKSSMLSDIMLSVEQKPWHLLS